MLGLIIVTISLLYLYVLYRSIIFGYRWGQARGLPIYKNIVYGFVGFSLFYFPVFWDFLPMLAMKKYYCSKEGGVFIYKTADQWKKENPLRAKKVHFYGGVGDVKVYKDKTVYQRKEIIASEFGTSRTYEDVVDGWISREDFELFDLKTGRALYLVRGFNSARGVGVTNFSLDSYKFWMRQRGCGDEWRQEAVLQNNISMLGNKE